MSREVQISKALSRLLRHQAENAGITLDGEGYAPLDRVVSSPCAFRDFFLDFSRGVFIFMAWGGGGESLCQFLFFVFKYLC
jgi:hypothetical protein